MRRLWASALGGEVMYGVDLPACCQREARAANDAFECASCGAVWQKAESPEAEECAFAAEERSHRGAA